MSLWICNGAAWVNVDDQTALDVPYTPTIGGDWSTEPEEVKAALDTLAGDLAGLSTDALVDADGDTSVEVEASADEDTVRVTAEGSGVLTASATADQAVLVTPAATPQTVLTVRGLAGHTANLLEAQNSKETVQMQVSSNGSLWSAGNAHFELLNTPHRFGRNGNGELDINLHSSIFRRSTINFMGTNDVYWKVQRTATDQDLRFARSTDGSTFFDTLIFDNATGSATFEDRLQPGPSTATCDADIEGSYRTVAAVDGTSVGCSEVCLGDDASPPDYQWRTAVCAPAS